MQTRLSFEKVFLPAFKASIQRLMAVLAMVVCSTAAHAQIFAQKTPANGLGSVTVHGVFASGTTVYAATNNGLSISTNGGDSFINRTTTHGLGRNEVYGVFASGTTV